MRLASLAHLEGRDLWKVPLIDFLNVLLLSRLDPHGLELLPSTLLIVEPG